MKYVSTIDKIAALETRLAVMKAFTKGSTIQLRHLSSTEWHDLTAPSPAWDWELYDYRVKPEPRLFYAVYEANGDVRVVCEHEQDAQVIVSMSPGRTYKKFVEEV